ncbi:MAG TPA: GNAT family N-acetyltransferase [Pseudonocardia sp.]
MVTSTAGKGPADGHQLPSPRTDGALLTLIDNFCDTLPRRWATVIDDGPLRLFLRDGPGWPFYARPVPGGPAVRIADVERMRERQRAAGVVEAFEWILPTAPGMLAAVMGTGLPARRCPLLVLDGEPAPVALPPGYDVLLLGPADGDLGATAHAVAAITAVAFGGPAPPPPTTADLRLLQEDLAAGAIARALITGPDGPVAAGSAQRSMGVIELVGIATARAARRRGFGAAVTSALAAAARAAGADLVFLAAGDDSAARVYERVGFRRVGECGISEPPTR